MKVIINNQLEQIPTNQSVQELMNCLYGNNTAGKAIAISNTVVAVGKWDSTKIKENDNILIITATQGG